MISFIIITYNSEKFIEQCLLSILKYASGTDFEIVIKDNNSKDNTVGKIGKFIKNNKNVKLIKSDINNGFAGGNNNAVKYSNGNLLFFINADAVLFKYDYKKIIELLNSDQAISIIQAKLRKMMDPGIVESTGHFIDTFGNAFIENENAKNREFPNKQIFAATGAAFIMKKEIFERLGGFDDDYFLFYEETDLCWRNNLLGYKAYYFNDLEVLHFGGGSVDKGSQREKTGKNYKIAHYYLRNKFISGIKNNTDFFSLLSFILGNLILYIFAIFFHLLKCDFKYSRVVVKSLAQVLYSLPKTFHKRASNKKIMKLFNSDLVKLKLVEPFSFFKWIGKVVFLMSLLFVANNVVLAANGNVLPHFYTPQAIIKTSQSLDTLPNIISQKDYNIRSAIYFNNNDVNATTSSLVAMVVNNTPVIEFKKINPTKYRVIIHHATDNFPLVFSESFHDGWKTYLVADKKLALNFNPADYKILDGNLDDHASPEELNNYINSGYISTLGNLKEQNIKHVTWENNREVFAYNEQYKIDFISKNFQDTIQNDNLESGSFYETWFKKPIADNHNHLMVNGYANSWNINPDELCGAPAGKALCVRNADGSYDLELVVEFWPQRLFYIGLFISGATLFGCLGYLGWGLVRRRRKRKEISTLTDKI